MGIAPKITGLNQNKFFGIAQILVLSGYGYRPGWRNRGGWQRYIRGGEYGPAGDTIKGKLRILISHVYFHPFIKIRVTISTIEAVTFRRIIDPHSLGIFFTANRTFTTKFFSSLTGGFLVTSPFPRLEGR